MSWRAGPRRTLPVQTLNCAPCHGQVSTSPSSSPSFSGPLICVQLSVNAQMSPFTLARQIGSPSTSMPSSSPSFISSSSATFINSFILAVKCILIITCRGSLQACKGQAAMQDAKRQEGTFCAGRANGNAECLQDVVFAKLHNFLHGFSLDHF